MELKIGEEIKATSGDTSFEVPVSMNNDIAVRALETIISDEDNNLVCNGCTAIGRAADADFWCLATEQEFGECKVMMLNPTDSSALIVSGDGPNFTVEYELPCAIDDDCINLELKDSLASDSSSSGARTGEVPWEHRG